MLAMPLLLRSLDRNSSATRVASTLSRMICGRMKMMSSVRSLFLSVVADRPADVAELVDERHAGAAVVLPLADQAGEQHGLAARDRDRALDPALRHRRRQRVGIGLPRRC